jgi:hypothetical protein
LIDGEGCIYIDPTLTPCLDVGMAETALPVLRDLHETFGGSLTMFRPATDKWQAGWAWSMSGRPCAELLERLLPYLRLKPGQASAVLALQQLKNSTMKEGGSRARWTPETRAKAEELRSLVKTMNRRGPEAGQWPTGATVLLVGDQRQRPQLELFGETHSAESSGTWPTSGTAWPTGSVIACSTHVSSECRSDAAGCSSSQPALSTILEGSVAPRYSLSARAAQGILRRAEKRGKRLPEHLAAALIRVACEPQTSTDTEPT